MEGLLLHRLVHQTGTAGAQVKEWPLTACHDKVKGHRSYRAN